MLPCILLVIIHTIYVVHTNLEYKCHILQEGSFSVTLVPRQIILEWFPIATFILCMTCYDVIIIYMALQLFDLGLPLMGKDQGVCPLTQCVHKYLPPTPFPTHTYTLAHQSVLQISTGNRGFRHDCKNSWINSYAGPMAPDLTLHIPRINEHSLTHTSLFQSHLNIM